MKLLCPVAKCHEKVSPENYYDHVIEYEEEHKDNPLLAKSHDRFANYFFPNIWNSSMAIKKKWRMVAQEYIKQQKSMKKQYKKQESQEHREKYGIEHFLR